MVNRPHHENVFSEDQEIPDPDAHVIDDGDRPVFSVTLPIAPPIGRSERAVPLEAKIADDEVAVEPAGMKGRVTQSDVGCDASGKLL
jgi:hypothetical protein